MNMIKISGIYNSDGKIILDTNRVLDWKALNAEKPSELPDGSKVEISISLDISVFLSGSEGSVWATYDLRQAEIIQNALLVQNISSEIRTNTFYENVLFHIRIINMADINDAIDFIWRDKNGLRLEPDWSYADGESNKSFEHWLSGRT